MKRVLFEASLIVALILAGCGGGNATTQPTLAPVSAEYAGKTNPLGADAAAAGAQVFKTNCETCHGPQGHGDGPAGQALNPQPRNLAELHPIAGDDFLFWRISEGKPGTSMIAWKGALTEEQIWQVVTFVRTLR